ncbi:MAG: hypothetical protein Fur0046_23820 [Cyanobacteria bacterium J069]|nr:MAG: hypothetical protein D6742_06050 [Cyanobacteria bacterium J069]
MFYTTDASGFSIDPSLTNVPHSPAPQPAQPSQPLDSETTGGWLGFAILATLLMASFGALAFGTVKLAEHVVLSQENAIEARLVR